MLSIGETFNNYGSTSVAVGDINNDDRLDIIVVDIIYNNVKMFLGLANESFETETLWPTGRVGGLESIVLVDLNSDTYLDIIVTNSYSNSIGLFFGYGNGSFSNQTVISMQNESVPIGITVSDLNNDSHVDIVVATQGNDQLNIFLGHGNGSFRQTIIFPMKTDSHLYSPIITDFNGNGYLDIAVANHWNHSIDILYDFYNETFTIQRSFSTGSRSFPISIAVGDLNYDGYLDIAVTNTGTNNIGILFGYGDGTFQVLKILSTDVYLPVSIAIGDINGDNYLDVIIANYIRNGISVFLQQTNHSFETQPISLIGSFPDRTSSLVVRDINGDQKLDIIFVTSFSIHVLLNTCDCCEFGYFNTNTSSIK